jgi:hypothetical protein
MLTVYRSAKVVYEGTTIKFRRPTALAAVQIISQVSQAHTSTSEDKYKDLFELYINTLTEYACEICDAEMEDESGNVRKFNSIKEEKEITFFMERITTNSLAQIFKEFIEQMNPTVEEKKS